MKKILLAALRAEHGAACPVARRRIALARRVALVGVAIFATRAVGDAAHFEVLHEGGKACVDGLIAFLIEKVCAVE